MEGDATLPNDLETCQRELRRVLDELAHARRVLEETAATAEEQQQEIEKLKAQLELLQRYLFGRRSERVIDSPGQGRLFEEPEGAEAPLGAEEEADEEQPQARRRRRNYGWGKLPENVPHEEVLIDTPEEERSCDCCGGPLERIGEDRTKRVDFTPPKIIIKVIVRPKYACPKKHGGVAQAPAPPAPTPGGRFDFGFVAQVLASKFADHLPFYRQQDILARYGIELGRSTLCDIHAGAAELLSPLEQLMIQRLLASGMMGVDDTPARLLDRSHPEGVRTARFWLYYGYEEAPYDVFDFHESRSRDGPAEFLRDFRGWVKVDAYGVNGGVYLGSDAILASCCWTHARRKFFDACSSHPRLSAEPVAYIRRLYDLEDQWRELSPEDRRVLRELEAGPVLAQLKAWLEEQRPIVLPKSALGQAISYTLNQWEALETYLRDGRLPIDNNETESELRRLTIGRKNWLFIGAPQAGPRAATIYTVTASAARHDLDVWAYLRDVLERLAVGESDLTSLLPDVWAKTHPEAIRVFRQRERERRANAKRERRARRRAAERAWQG